MVLSLLFNQIKNFLSLLLIIAMVLSFFVGDQVDAILIGGILVLNTALGFWQEYKASKELEALRKLEVAFSRVIRNGQEIKIPSSQLVIGDTVVLESGDKIPADGVIIEAFSISVNESTLTGESLPVPKSPKAEENQLFLGTSVVSGRATMRVEAIGQNTRFGKIALTLASVEDEQTPLEISLNNVAKRVALAVIGISVLVGAYQLFIAGTPTLEVMFSSIALMVAAVPEGLPAIITVILAIGVNKMYRKKALVRKLSAIESLGATNVICTDKTGTLTMNQMRVAEVSCPEKDLPLAIKAGVLCNSATLVGDDILGDTTEGALLRWGKEKNILKETLKNQGKLSEEIPFDLQRRMMSIVWEESGKKQVFSKGAPEKILPLCKLSESRLAELTAEYQSLAKKGLRVLALAHKPYTSGIIEKDLEFLALVGIADAPRPEAAQAIAQARTAGISVVMITGDNELTAASIGEQLGLLMPGDEVITGSQLEEMTDQQLLDRLEKIRIFARAVPEHKLRIVRAYQSLGKVVAVTGDGVNDSLALKQAQVGVAMGISGTDVAKEASDIIILDDNLSTIVVAVEQGRIIYHNILKVIRFLLTGNLSELLVIVVITLLGYPSPLLPVQVLWLNFVSDGLPALSLANDPASSQVMRHPPRDTRQSILNTATLRYIGFFGGLIGLINIGIFMISYQLYPLPQTRAIVFTTMVVSQMIFIFVMRRHHAVTSNKYLLLSVSGVLIAQALILFYPPLMSLFKIN